MAEPRGHSEFKAYHPDTNFDPFLTPAHAPSDQPADPWSQSDSLVLWRETYIPPVGSPEPDLEPLASLYVDAWRLHREYQIPPDPTDDVVLKMESSEPVEEELRLLHKAIRDRVKLTPSDPWLADITCSRPAPKAAWVVLQLLHDQNRRLGVDELGRVRFGEDVYIQVDQLHNIIIPRDLPVPEVPPTYIHGHEVVPLKVLSDVAYRAPYSVPTLKEFRDMARRGDFDPRSTEKTPPHRYIGHPHGRDRISHTYAVNAGNVVESVTNDLEAEIGSATHLGDVESWLFISYTLVTLAVSIITGVVIYAPRRELRYAILVCSVIATAIIAVNETFRFGERAAIHRSLAAAIQREVSLCSTLSGKYDRAGTIEDRLRKLQAELKSLKAAARLQLAASRQSSLNPELHGQKKNTATDGVQSKAVPNLDSTAVMPSSPRTPRSA